MFNADLSLLKKYVIVFAGVIFPLMSLSFLWFSYNMEKQVHNSLHTASRVLRCSDGIGDYGEFVSRFGEVRVTLADGGGNVLADNKADAAGMGNHANRPEFVQARAKGYGEDIRRSVTTGKKTIYVATKLKNGSYVRFAQSTELTYEFLLWLFTPIVFLSFCLAVLMFVFARNRKLERMRQEFVANISHDLKTPLTSIKGYAELTATGLISCPDKVKEYQRNIGAQSDRLLEMINDILHLSQLESTKPKNLAAVDTRAVAEQVKEALKQMADRKNIIIQVTGTGKITAETKPIYQMIYNLADNGIKYGKPGGVVKITLNGKKITVSDDGTGIPQEDVERVFERFYRVDKSRSQETGGTGLGLTIVKHTVHKYNGTVSLKSGEGDGTQVYIEFKR
jgi:two-component system phosphate regulon sensor histidine kinase PhoR